MGGGDCIIGGGGGLEMTKRPATEEMPMVEKVTTRWTEKNKPLDRYSSRSQLTTACGVTFVLCLI